MLKNLSVLISIIFFLLPILAKAYGSESILLASICKSTQNCRAINAGSVDYVDYITLKCEIEIEAQKCGELAKAHPQWAPLMRRCDLQSLCQQNENYMREKNFACLRGYTNATIDLGIAIKDAALGLDGIIGDRWTATKANLNLQAEFIKECDKHIGCKRDLIKGDQRYANISDQKISKISAGALFVQAEERNYQQKTNARLAYNKNAASELSEKINRSQIARDLDTDTQQKKDILLSLIKDKIKEQYSRYACYNPIAREELECYALGGVLDPLALAGYFAKAGRAAAATRLLDKAEESTEVLKNLKRIDDANPESLSINQRSKLTANQIAEMPQVKAAVLPKAIQNLPPNLKVESISRADGTAILQYSFAEKLPDGTWVRSQSELPLDPLTGSINANFTSGRDFFSKMVEAKAGQAHLAFIDVGSLGAVNTKFQAGSAAGDRYLKAVADEILKNGDGKVTLARLGGDEFGLLIDSAKPQEVKQILENIQNGIRKNLSGDAHQVFRDEKIVRAENYKVQSQKLAAENPDGKLTAANKEALQKDIDELALIQQPDISVGSAQVGQRESLDTVLSKAEDQAKKMKIKTTLKFGRSAEKYGSNEIPRPRPDSMYQATIELPASSKTWKSPSKTSLAPGLDSIRAMKVIRQDEISRVEQVTLARYEDELGRSSYRVEKFIADTATGEKMKISTEIPTRGTTGLLDGMHPESKNIVMQQLKNNPESVLIMPKLTSLRYLNYFENGTKAGDDMLEAVSKALKNSLRSDDLSFKLNGADFLLSVKTASPESMQKIIQKVNADVLTSPAVKAIIDKERSVLLEKARFAKQKGDVAMTKKFQQKLKELENYKPDLKFESLSAKEVGSMSFDDVMKTFDTKFLSGQK